MSAGANTIALHSTAEGLPLYEKLGFRMTGPVHTHRGRFAGHRDGCAVARRGGGYLRVCVEGPVIAADELDHVDPHAGAPA